ncbi:MAG: sulfatase-like hydrolase/transferase, partial [Opitutaceae bacterium]|nr:sulfatase-like hydrolase/transferase [Cytophagales bacterium]
MRKFKTKSKVMTTALVAVGFVVGFAQSDIDKTWKGKIGKSLSESESYPIEYVKKAPKGAPNIVWILLDDVGFGAISPYGGLINTPTFESLSQQGLKYTNFHTTGICSPTRTALLTGRNHHSAHMGTFPNPTTAADFPGYDGKIPREKATIA